MKRIIAIVLIVLLGLPTIFVQAETPSDAVITMQDAAAFRNLGASGDMLILAHIRWSTGNATSTPASSAVSVRLVSDNGTTITAKSPYVFSPFDDNGYGDFVVSFYLSDNTTWGDNTTIQVVGLPAYFVTPPIMNYTMGAADYTDELTQDDNRAAMKTYVLNLTDILRTIYPLVELKSQTDSGTVLSSYGEAYFSSVIEGLQVLCPSLFFVQTYVPEEITTQDYDMSTGDTYTARLLGTDIMLGATRIGAYIGVSGAVFFAILTFVGCIAVIVAAMRKGWKLEAALLIDVGILTGMAILVGDLLFTLIMIIGLLAVIGIAFAIFGKRA